MCTYSGAICADSTFVPGLARLGSARLGADPTQAAVKESAGGGGGGNAEPCGCKDCKESALAGNSRGSRLGGKGNKITRSHNNAERSSLHTAE